jgi:hypothetical protein
VHDERPPGFEEAFSDGRAHVAETDQPNGETGVCGDAHCAV